MFIRTTKKIVKKNGKNYEYLIYRLVESIRTENGPRQNTIINMGKLNLDENQIKPLSDAINAILNKQPILFTPPPDVIAYATHFAELVIRKRTQTNDNHKIIHQPKIVLKNSSNNKRKMIISDDPKNRTTDYETVDINSISTSNNRSISLEHIALTQIKQLGLFNILEDCDFTKTQQNQAVAQICGRLIHPDSERETARWLRETTALDELLSTNFSNISDNTLHRTADLLYKNKDKIEKQLSTNTRTLFSLDDSFIFYDLTNTYFESSKRNSRIAKYGKSKERRNDCPIVTLALVVDSRGFPKMSKIYKGNISEGDTLFEILEQMVSVNENDAPKTVIIDAGIATEKNLEKLRNDSRFEYVAVSRKKIPKELFNGSTETILGLSKQKNLKVKSVKQNNETYLLCTSEDKEKRDKNLFETKKKKFENGLKSIRDGLKKKGTRKNYDYIQQRIGRLKERYKIGNYYKIDVKKKNEKENKKGKKKENKKGKEIAIDISWSFTTDKQKPYGEYLLRTSRKDLDDKQISELHRTLTMIESSFRWMKSELGLRPNYHQRDERMSSHIFISVLAYFVLAPILSKLKENDNGLSTAEKNEEENEEEKKGGKRIQNRYDIPQGWRSIVRLMQTQTRLTTSFFNKAKKRIDIRTTIDATQNQQSLYNRLGISSNPLPRVKHKQH